MGQVVAALGGGFGRRPLPGRGVLRTRDPDEAQRGMSALFASHALQAQGARFFAEVRQVRFEGVSINFVRYDGDVRIRVDTLGRFYLIGIPLAGRSVVSYGGRETLSVPGMAAVQPPDSRVVVDWRDDCRKMVVQIESDLLARMARLHGPSAGRRLHVPPSLDVSGGAGRAWLDLVAFLCRSAGGGDPLWSTPLVAGRAADMVAAGFLAAQQGGVAAAVRGGSSVAPFYVKRAEAFIEAHAADPIGLAEIAAASGASERTVLAGFRRYRDMTPMQFLRAVRLARVHDDLSVPGCTRSVTEIALQWGFLHQGRFAGDFRRRYGVLPSDLRRFGSGDGES
jgi:AraC-like DNA-binding protein